MTAAPQDMDERSDAYASMAGELEIMSM